MSRSALLGRCLSLALCSAAYAACAPASLEGVDLPSPGRAAAPAFGPETAATLARLGDHTSASGDVPTAIALYRRAHEAAPDDPGILLKLGSALARVGAAEEAAGAYRAAVRLSPTDREALRGLGNAEIALGRPAEALAWLEAALALGDSAEARNSLGVALDLQGRHTEAQQHYLQGLALKPYDVDLASNYALSLALVGRDDEAVARQRDVAASPSATPRHRLNLALALGLAGRMDEAAAVAGGDLDPATLTALIRQYSRLRNANPIRPATDTGGSAAGAATAAPAAPDPQPP